MNTEQAFQVSYTGHMKGRVTTHFDRESAERATTYWPGSAGTMTEVSVSIFEAGDEIEVELHRGAVENDDGISKGGRWIAARGFVRVMDISPRSGWLVDGADRVIQAMSLVAGEQGYPYRNARLVQQQQVAA